MAKAIKTLALVSAFSLVISSFSACSLSFGNDDPTTEITTTEKAIDSTEPTEPQTTTEAETTTEVSEKTDTIGDIFADIKKLPVGTAGSSSKAAALALRLIAFSSSDSAESESLTDDVKKLVETVEDEDVYDEALYQINSYAKKFFKDNQSDVVEIAGQEDFPLDKEYSQEKYQQIYEMLQK